MKRVEMPATSFRLTPTARRLLAALAVRQGVSRTAIIERLIRQAAKDEGVR